MMLERLRILAQKTIASEAAFGAFEDLVECSALGADGPADSFLISLGNLMVISPPMLDSLRRHPEWLKWLSQKIKSPEDPAQRRRAWTSASAGPANFMESLRTFKRRECLEIAYRDISGLDAFCTTVKRLSELADWVIARALEHCWEELLRESQSPPGTLHPPSGFAVIALGKLGASELNYSSDVDLLFCRRTSDDKQELRFFTRLGERLARSLAHPGLGGFLYRVDMRLRPYGETGPLVPTLDSLATYYESWGEAWERQAMIKARHVAGDAALGRRFEVFAERFVFARQMGDSSLEEIKRVKHRSEKEYSKPGNRAHIKQGPGGIRDIEFYVQFHQLIAGPKVDAARARSTLEALAALQDAKILLEGELSQLSLAYLFLRTVEHRLQLRTFTPQATVPEVIDELELVARGLGFEDGPQKAAETFRVVLDRHRSRVREILERIYLTPGYLRLRDRDEEFAQLLSERTPKGRIRELLSGYGFNDIEKAWQNLRLMALGPDGKILPPGERRAFLEFAFPLLEVMRDSLDPDQALHKLESFAAATGNRVSFLRALASRRPHLARLSNLLALSNLSHQILTRHPEYFDSLARGIHLHEGRPMDDMHRELSERFGASPRGEGRESVIRRFRQREMIRVAYRDLAGLADSLEISAELSDLAEACVKAAADLTGPSGTAFAPDDIAPVRILAMGKLGGRQMHYSSDLDLVFLYDSPPDRLPAAERADIQQNLDARIERFLEFIAGVTTEGVAYRIDLRLRPEGSHGLLARSWPSFMDYARDHMQPWERMALVRSRMLFAPEEMSRRWQEALEQIVYSHEWDSESIEAVRHLKRRIEAEKNRESRSQIDFKYGKGGIADLEFLVQFLQLHHGRKDAKLRAPSVAAALHALGEAEVLSAAESRYLLEAHRFQRRLENHYQLMEEWAAREISRESPALVPLARSLGYKGESGEQARKQFLADWDERARFVRSVVEKYFYS
jgi:glutamate-ammonia-ligase adenylyltransferase